MKSFRIFTMLLFLMGVTGCKAPKLTWTDVQDRFDAHRHETVNDMYYIGSDESDHYLFHAYLTTYIKRVYRINKAELNITNEFPMTENQEAWRKVEIPLRIDSNNVTIIEANHGLESTSAPPAAGTPETHP